MNAARALRATAGALLHLAAGALLLFGPPVVGFTLYVWALRPAVRQAPAVSGSQIERIADAVWAHAGRTGRRPERLAELVAAGLLQPAELFATDRRPLPPLDAQAGRFAVEPDVLYVPAVREEDPGDLVLLCTVLLPTADAEYQVIFNSGRHAELTGPELVEALQRTYAYLGDAIRQ